MLPTYNRVQYLREAVDSVLAQTFRDWELLVADDGSGAETARYLAELEEHPRVQILWREHSGNPSAVRNAAIRVAGGAYVAFLDSDDLWLPTKLETQTATQRSHPECRWSYVAMERVYENGTLMARAPQNATPQGAIFADLLALGANMSMSSIMVERALLEEIGGFDESQLFFEDFDLFLRLSLRSEVALVRQPLVRMRSHQEHYSADRISMLEGRAQLLRKMQSSAEQLGLARLVRREQDRNAADLARVHAVARRRGVAVRLLWRSRRVWREGCWWRACGATVKSLMPSSLRRAYRWFRHGSPAET